MSFLTDKTLYKIDFAIEKPRGMSYNHTVRRQRKNVFDGGKAVKRIIAVIITLFIFAAAVPTFAFASVTVSGTGLCEEIARGLDAHQDEIDVSQWHITPEELGDYYEVARYLAPAAFDLDFAYGYTTVSGSTARFVNKVKPRYTMNADEYARARQAYGEKLASIVALVPRGLDGYGIALFLHDYICANFSYSQPGEYLYDAYGLLTTGSGVCEAYTKLYIALLAEFGIKSYPVSSTAINHAWNELLIGNNWYHVDVTWGDPVPDSPGRAAHADFLCSSEKFQSDHGTGFVPVFAADDDSFDEAEWHGYDLPFAFADGKIYGVSDEGIIRRYDIASGAYEDIYTIEARWPALTEYSFWKGNFSGVAAYGGKLIYNDARSFYSYDLATGTAAKVYTPETDDTLNIYGCYNFGETLFYITGPKDNASDTGNFTLNVIELPDIIAPEKPKYTVRFVDWDGAVISEALYEEGGEITVPADPVRQPDETYTYTFSGWSPQVCATAVSDVTYTARYDQSYIEYTVSFSDWDGTVIKELTLHYGDEIVPPSGVTREADETYTYEFEGWDKEPPANCEGNASYAAVYKATYIEYTVKFLDWDGSVISEKNYHYGDEVEIPADPVREPEGERAYVFSGWDSEPERICRGSAVYTAEYIDASQGYKITFLDHDGTVLAERICAAGDIPREPAAPAREADKTYSYVFTGWDKQIVPADGDAVYTAVYEERYIEYTVKFVDHDGSVISEKTYHYGDEAEIPSAPVRDADKKFSYAFTGWDPVPARVCEGDAVYAAVYEERYIEYTVKFLDYDGSVISEKIYHYGDEVEIPSDPAREADDKYTYAFAGWGAEPARVCEGDAVYTAEYSGTEKPQPQKFIRGDVNGNGKIDAADYAMCKRACLRTYELSAEQLMRADINGNGRPDASEYAMIKRHYLGTYTIPQDAA